MTVYDDIWVHGATIRIGETGSINLDQRGKIVSLAWSSGHVGDKALVSDWRPHVVQAVEYVQFRSGRKRHGTRSSAERCSFLGAVVVVAREIKDGNGPEEAWHPYLKATP